MQNNHTKQYHVFLSHSSSDKTYVERIAERLEDGAGLKPFLDKWHLVPGEPWQEALEEALDSSETCAVFLGPRGVGPWENEELRSALDERVKDKSLRVIPVLLPGANPKDSKTLPRFLRRLTWVDFRTGIDEEEAFNRLVAGIQGKHPGRQSPNSKQKKKVQWVLVLSGTIEDMDKAHVEAIAIHLRQLSRDMTLTIKKIEEGSVKLIIESSHEGFERINTLFEQGQLRDLLGIDVLDVILDSHLYDLKTASQIMSSGAYFASQSDFALLDYAKREYTEAEQVYQWALTIIKTALGPEHPDVARALSNLAVLYKAQGKYTEAEPLFKRALAIQEKEFGPDHPEVARSLNNLALLHRIRWKYTEAEPLFKRALAIREKALGSEHPDVARTLSNLAVLYKAQGKYAEAGPLFRRALAIREKELGPDHPEVARSLNDIALFYKGQDNHPDVESMFRRALLIWENALGPKHPDLAIGLNNLGVLYFQQNKYDEAQSLFRHAQEIEELALGQEHPDLAHTLSNLAAIYMMKNDFLKAKALFERVLAIREKALGPEHPGVVRALNNLAALHDAQGKKTEALSLFEQAVGIQAKMLGIEWFSILSADSDERAH
jgi:tetratricopeptide (TPR) repeat protein